MAVPIGEAQLLGIFLQAIVYGIYLVTVGRCAHALLEPKDGSQSLYLIDVAAAMVLLVTLNIAVCFRYVLDTFST